jgi:hypothetical protein
MQAGAFAGRAKKYDLLSLRRLFLKKFQVLDQHIGCAIE